MTLRCPHCGRTLKIPTERAKPAVKVQCPGCRQVFAVADAAPAPAAAPRPTAPPPAAPQPPQAPAAPPAAAPPPAPPQAPAAPPAAAPPPAPPPAPPQAPAAPPAAAPPPAPPQAAAPPPAPPQPPQAPAAPPAAAPPAGAAAAAAASGAASRAGQNRAPRPGNWRTCSRHNGQRSEGVCSECGKGWCGECLQHHGTAAICPECDALCTSTQDREARERADRQRRRPLRDELGTVLSYPLRDPMAYIMMALAVGVFSFAAKVAAFGGMIAMVFYYGLLYAYAFTAINRVSSGDTTNFMPNISDITDLLKQVFLGLAAMIVSMGPLILLIVLGLGAAMAMIGGGGGSEMAFDEGAPPPEFAEMLREQGMSEEEIAELEESFGGELGEYDEYGDDESDSYADEGVSVAALGTGIGVLIAAPFALLWALLYSPIALIAAAISQSFFATLNPVNGVDAIRRMGSVYWEAWLIYTGIVIVGGFVGGLLGMVPLLGSFLAAFVESYTFLSFGCLLGFAVFKKAVELGVD